MHPFIKIQLIKEVLEAAKSLNYTSIELSRLEQNDLAEKIDRIYGELIEVSEQIKKIDQ